MLSSDLHLVAASVLSLTDIPCVTLYKFIIPFLRVPRHKLQYHYYTQP